MSDLTRADHVFEQALSAYQKAVLTNRPPEEIRHARVQLLAAMVDYEQAAVKQVAAIDPRHVRPPRGETKGL